MTPSKISPWAARWAVGILLACAAWWSTWRPFNHDELEAVHSAWKVLQGQLPYVDFFQHHHPLLYAYLAPVISLSGERPASLLCCRLAMLPFWASTAAAAYFIALRIFGRQTALLSAVLLLASWPFMVVAMEMRPDSPEVALGTIALALLMWPRTRSSWLWHALIGICLGVSFLFVQKAIFFIGAAGLLLLWRIHAKLANWTDMAAMLSGLAVSVAPLAVWVFFHQMIDTYVFLNWTLNAHFRDHFSPVGQTALACVTQPVTLVLAAATLAALLTRRRRHREIVLLAALLCLQPLAARSPYMHYWMPVMPFAAIFAAYAFTKLFEHRRAMAAALLCVCLATPIFIDACCGMPSNRRQLARIGYVLDTVGPNETIYDGNALFNVFRHDVDYFWYSVAENEGLETYRSLRDCRYDVYACIDRAKPKIISLHEIDDPDDPRIRDHYGPSPAYKDLWMRKNDQEEVCGSRQLIGRDGTSSR